MHRARRGFLFLLLSGSMLAAGSATAADLTARERGQDFDVLWRAIDTGYAYFDANRGEWRRLRAKGKRDAERADSRAQFVAALETSLAALHDDHVTLSERSPAAHRRIPFETDLWAAWKNGAATIEAVRTFGDADVAGLRPGDVVTRVDGVPVERAVREYLGTAPPTPRAKDWALRHVLAGPRAGVERIEIRAGSSRNLRPMERVDSARANAAAVTVRRIGERRDIAYLRLRIGAADDRIVERFDEALDELAGTRALILDLRDNPGPGSREVTRAILARFIASPQTFQTSGKPRATDILEPRGAAPVRGPVVALIDRWTAGEGETLAEGLAALANAQLVGTRTAGLHGELRETRLPHSGITVRYPAERVFRKNGEPRDTVRPTLEVDLAAPQGGPGDPILYQALKLLEPCPGPACRIAPGSPPRARAFPPR